MSEELRIIRDDLQHHIEWVYALRGAPLSPRALRSVDAAATSLLVVNDEVEKALRKREDVGVTTDEVDEIIKDPRKEVAPLEGQRRNMKAAASAPCPRCAERKASAAMALPNVCRNYGRGENDG